MDEFVEAHRGSTELTIQAYEAELDRMLELKRERMSTFVENARAEISKLWDDLMVGEQERAEFAPFADGKCISVTPIYADLTISRRAHGRASCNSRRRSPKTEGRTSTQRLTSHEHQEILRYLPRGERTCCCRVGPNASPWKRATRSWKIATRREDEKAGDEREAQGMFICLRSQEIRAYAYAFIAPTRPFGFNTSMGSRNWADIPCERGKHPPDPAGR